MNCVAIALLLLLGATISGGTSYVGYLTRDDLYNALNTPSPFWLIYRSHMEKTGYREHTCVYSLKIRLTYTEYEFDQYYKIDSEWHNQRLYASISRGHHAHEEPELDVSKSRGGHGRKYTLRHWDPINHCGVLTFQKKEDGVNHCEMYAWQANLQGSGRYACQSAYDQLCGHMEKHWVYTRDCRA
ncbi:uncharacterized protein LOC144110297 [Amblyomma americanum]